MKKNIVYKNPNELKPYGKNAKKHPKSEIDRLAKYINKLGWRGTILIDSDDVIVAGHGRTLAAIQLNLKEIPCEVVDDLTEEEINELRLVDNKLNESEWDMDFLMEDLPQFDELMDDFDWGIDGVIDPPELDQGEEKKNMYIQISFGKKDELLMFMEDIQDKMPTYESHSVKISGIED